MAKALMVLPWKDGAIAVDLSTASWVIGSYAPPPAGTAQYVLVWLEADQALIDTLTARADCLFICARAADGSFEKTAITATARNAMRTKVSNMGFTGAKYGLLNAAIQSSANRADVAAAIATKAFCRDAAGNSMTADDVAGTRQGAGAAVK